MPVSATSHSLLAGLVFILLGLLSSALTGLTGAELQLWLPEVFALAVLMRRGRPHWPITLLVFVVADMLVLVGSGLAPLPALVDTALHLFSYAGGAYGLLRLPAQLRRNDTLRSVLLLMGLYLLVFSPLLALLAGWFVAGTVAGADVLSRSINYWLGDVLAMLLLFVPAYCLDIEQLRSLRSPRRWLTLLLLLLLGTASSFVLLMYLPFPYIYVALPLGVIALQYSLLKTVIVVPLSLLCSTALLWSGYFVQPLWLQRASADALLAATITTVFFPYLIALSNRFIKTQRAQLEELKERLELAADAIGLGVWDWHVQTGALHWDKRLYALYGISPDEGSNTYEMWRSRVHPDDISAAESCLQAAVQGTGEYRMEFRVVLPGGKIRWMMAAAEVLRNPEGQAVRVVGMNWDNTERKQAELNYLNAKHRLQGVIDAAEDFSIIATDINGTIELFSRGAERMLGYSAAEMEYKQSPAILHDMQEVMARGEELSAEFGAKISGFDVFVFKSLQGSTEKRQWTYLHKNGHRLQVRLTISAIHDVDKNLIGFLGIAQNISEEIESRDALQFALEQINEQAEIADQAKQQFETLFTLAPEPLLVVNQAGFIVQANLRAHELFKYTGNGLLGLSVDALVPDNIRTVHQHNREQYNAAPRKRIMGKGLSLSGKQKDGVIVPLDINLAPIIIRNQMHTIVTLHDVSLERQTHQLLMDAAAKAEAMSRAKSEFVASMSHEIRTPMNAVLASSQLLQNTPLSHDQNRYVRMINNAGKALLGILNDILDFSKIEAGKFELQDIEFDLQSLCESLASIMGANATQKNIELVIDVDPAAPVVLRGDAARLQQVMINLLGNAIKFTEQGEVVLKVKLLGRKDGHAQFYFGVKDTGIGISEDNKTKVFGAFSQVDGSNTRKYGGTGLGLAISQRLVKLMGGEIDLHSTPGVGSEFYFTLDLPVVREKSREYQPISDLEFMVLDANASSRGVIAQYLQAWGYKHQLFASASDVPRQVSAPTCYLLDWDEQADMPALIRELNQQNMARVLVLFSGVNGFVAEDYPQLQIAGIINKPVLGSNLNDAIMNVYAKASQPAQRSLLNTPHPLADCRILLVEDNALNQIVAVEILENLGAQVMVADNGLHALEILREKAAVFDVVLMDVQMPVMDGFEATRKIRYELGLTLPVLAMTAGVMASERQGCIDAGMNDFIAKPIDIPQMLATIQANFFKS